VLLIAGGLGLLVAILAALGLYGAEQLTRPRRSDLEDTAERWGLPEPSHLDLTAVDGVRLSAWWFPAPEANASVIVAHGHGANKASSLWVAAELFPRFNVLLLDLRGHGQSGGERTSVGFLERLDILAAVSWLDAQAGERPIGVLGISMGGATAILAAGLEERPRIAAVVADSPFARLRSPVLAAICERGYPRAVSPVLAWSVCTIAGWQVRARRALDPIDVVQRIAPRPLLIIHGEADALIPVENAYALYHRAGQPKELWVVPGVEHARVAESDLRAYADRVRTFFERWLLDEQSAVSSQRVSESAVSSRQSAVSRRERS
jgi:fermentation-respiration switch protein FrsA (DUF1100 family)